MRKQTDSTAPRAQLLEALNRTEESLAELDRRRERLVEQIPTWRDFERIHDRYNPITDRQQQVFAINLAKALVQWQTTEPDLCRFLGFCRGTIQAWLACRWRVTTRSLQRINRRLAFHDAHRLIDVELSHAELEKVCPFKEKPAKGRKAVKHG